MDWAIFNMKYSVVVMKDKYLTPKIRQFRVEIEGYSVAYFDRIAVFEVLYRSTSIKGRAHTCSVVT